MPGFIDAAGNYYEGDRQGEDQEVPSRPSPLHLWDGTTWAEDPMAYRARRAEAFADELPIGDQLDAMIKAFGKLKAAGHDLGPDAEAVMAKSAEIKARHPKTTT